MIPLKEIDIERVKKVRSGELYERGCGKTIAKMLDLLHHLRYTNEGNRYLFIAENSKEVRVIFHEFSKWVKEIGCIPIHNRNNSLKVLFNPVYPSNDTFMDKLFNMIESPEPIKYSSILFDFTSLEMLRHRMLRGMRYNGVVIDVTFTKQIDNAQLIDEIFYLVSNR